MDKKKISSLLITGDLNYSDIQWNDQGGFFKRTGRPSSIEFLDTINRNYLSQFVHESTFNTNMYYILILTNKKPARVVLDL
jgi:hypothetical protein